MSNDLFSLEDQAAMQQNQQIRRKIVNDITKNGTEIPAENEHREFLLKAMDGSDKVILARAKIKSDDTAAKAQAGAAAAITDLLLSIGPKAKRAPALPSQREAPVIDLETVVDETSIGVRTFSFDEIMKAGQPGNT